MDPQAFESLEQPDSLLVRVKSSIEEAILQGKIRPGERLIEDELAKIFKVSRGPIREAFCHLEKDGFIKIFPRKGAVVENISNEDIVDIYQVRSVLEGLAAKLFCMRAEDKDLERLERILKSMETDLGSGDISGYRRSNMEFHEVFIEGSNNSRIAEIFKTIQKQIKWFQNLTLSYVGRPEISLKEHRNILNAFIDRDSQRAEQEARLHIEHALELYQEMLRKGEKRELKSV